MKRFLSLIIIFSLLLNTVAYADTVIIGTAPVSGGTVNNGVVSSSYINAQSVYTGPGTVPSSAVSNASSPTSYDTNLGTSDSGPTVTVITSPADNEQRLRTTQTNIISNGVNMGSSSSSTSDLGPVVKEILAPVADHSLYSNDYYPNNVSQNANNQSTNTQTSTGAPQNSSQANSVITVNNVNNNTTTSRGGIPTQVATGLSTTNQNAGGPKIYKARANIASPNPSISSSAAMVVNSNTGEVYYSKNPFALHHPASLVNLVTAYLLISYKNLNDVMSVSASAVTGLESGATVAGLRAGDVITVKDALGAMFVKGCCDVANVVAENVGGSIQNFVAMMNQTAKDMGCINTVFTNPSGLNNASQVTTVYDMTLIMDKVAANPVLAEFMRLQAYTLPQTASRGALTLYSKNSLLIPSSSVYYSGLEASRMGYTSVARYTLASSTNFNGQRLIAVVLKSNGTQFSDSKKLLNFAKTVCLEIGTTQLAAQAQAQTQAQASTVNIGQALQLSNNTQTNNIPQNTNVSRSSSGNWGQDGNGWYYIQNGQRVVNEWITEGNKRYFIGADGYMIVGWRLFSNGNYYYFDPSSGELKYNTWINTQSGAYYLQSDGSLAVAPRGTTKNITTAAGVYTIDENGKAISKVN